MHRITPWACSASFLLYLGAAAFTPDRTPDGFRIGEFARLPVVMNGRVQPIDSIARAGLRRIRDTSEPWGAPPWQFWTSARTVEASEWLLELLTKPDAADARRIFAIHDPTLVAVLRLRPTPGDSQIDTYAELKAGARDAGAAGGPDQRHRRGETSALANRVPGAAEYDRPLRSAEEHPAAEHRLAGRCQRETIGCDFAADIAQYQKDLHADFAAIKAAKDGHPQDRDTVREQRMDAFARPFLGVSRAAIFSMVPRLGQARERDRWQNMGDSVAASMKSGEVSTPAAMFATMSSAFARGNAGGVQRSGREVPAMADAAPDGARTEPRDVRTFLQRVPAVRERSHHLSGRTAPAVRREDLGAPRSVHDRGQPDRPRMAGPHRESSPVRGARTSRATVDLV